MNAALNRRALFALPPSARLGWGLALAASALLAGLAALPPWLPSGGRELVQQSYAVLCHQLPARSPHLHGVPFALCHRCFGIAAGLAAGVALAPVLAAWMPRLLEAIRRWAGAVIAGALVPLGLDWGLGVLRIWSNTPLSRTATGLLFGLAAGVVLAVGIGVGGLGERRESCNTLPA